LQAVEVDLMNAARKVKVSDGFLHGVAPSLFLAIYFIPSRQKNFVR
jgi:hypothetical protein